MTISHILILLAFIGLGSAGISFVQEGISDLWQYTGKKMPFFAQGKAAPSRNMTIVEETSFLKDERRGEQLYKLMHRA